MRLHRDFCRVRLASGQNNISILTRYLVSSEYEVLSRKLCRMDFEIIAVWRHAPFLKNFY